MWSKTLGIIQKCRIFNILKHDCYIAYNKYFKLSFDIIII